MTLPFEMFVPGLPKPQGSKRGFATKSGRVAMVEMSKGLKDWRGDVRRVAIDEWEGELVEGALRMIVSFRFPRPKAHFHTGKKNAGKLKANAPFWVTKRPDLSKLIRGIEDALEGVIYKDDSQIAVCDSLKIYAEQPGVKILLRKIT